MEATVKILITPQGAVPVGGARVPWLDRHGPPPKGECEVAAVATLADWARGGAGIEPSGETGISLYSYSHPLYRRLRAAALRLIAETGQVPEKLPAAIVAAEIDAAEEVIRAEVAERTRKADEARAAGFAALEEAEAAPEKHLPGPRHLCGRSHLRCYDEFSARELQDPAVKERMGRLSDRLFELFDARVAEADARKAAERVAHETERAKHETERAAWIADHGSHRLKLLLEEGFGLAETYRDERLTVERPGWAWYVKICGETTGIRDAAEEALDALVTARATVPDASLEWLAYGDCDCHTETDDGYTDADPFHARPVLTAKLLGRTIVREIAGE